MTEKIELDKRIRIAYKKLKASVYFDKTQLPLRDRIVAFETLSVEEKLTELYTKLSGDNKAWDTYEDGILGKIGVLVFPKKLCDWSKDEKAPIIFNTDNEPVMLKKAQYFIDLSVEGHILSVLWILSIGLTLDNRKDPDGMNMYEHSYGNRLKKTLINPETGDITYSPNLFEPYFAQYESWRDKALEYAKNRLDDKQDALILTLDFKNFYYSVDIQEQTYKDLIENPLNNWEQWHYRVHTFVYKVLCTYSKILSGINADEEMQIRDRTILPIGFLPSNILSNWALKPFDDAIIKRLNPVYYGRYVDDIIIVDKVEKNSLLHKWALGTNGEDNKLTTKRVIEYYFRSCAADRAIPTSCTNGRELFKEVLDDEKTKLQKKEKLQVYRINPVTLESKNSDIQIQNDKVKIFYFREGATRALLDCFRTQIAQNASEFRFLPDMDTTLDKNNYSEIFCLSSNDTIHKLRGVTGVSLDKFSLSKFLGKYRKVGSMIRDKKETAFDKDLTTILDKYALIENYTLWERLLEIMIVNDRLGNYEKLIANILDAIIEFKIPEDKVKIPENKAEALLRTLRAAICRTAALRWGESMEKTIGKVEDAAKKKLNKKITDNTLIEIFSRENIYKIRKGYCISRMVNKYVMPILIDCVKQDVLEETASDICLYKLEDVMGRICDVDAWVASNYYPYMVTPQELSFALACQKIGNADTLLEPRDQRKQIEKMYRGWNYPNLRYDRDDEYDEDKNNSYLRKIKVEKLKDSIENQDRFAISVDDGSLSKLKVSIGNARLNPKDFQKVLTGKANRGYKRYQQLSELLRAAICEHVDLLVLPENYLPWEWIPEVARLCANNQMGLITGIEHVVSPNKDGTSQTQRKVYNLTAVILPYRQEDYKFTYITFHQKVHFSPEEKRQIAGYRFVPSKGKYHHLFQWRDVWFSVYCCFELASIQERALFKSFADLMVAVEWNKDVEYFSSIVESLCRDLHCFCIQANSSDYGDSRVMSPSRTLKRDLIKTKGGINSAILVDEIDINALREFQRKEYELQREDDTFKPTPPNFDPNIPMYKQNGTMWKYMEEKLFVKRN